jgi:uncharacterized protein YrrD
MQFQVNKEQPEQDKPFSEEEFPESNMEFKSEEPFDDIGVSYEEIPEAEERNLAGMIGHDIISLKDGAKIARIEDILIDPENLHLAAVITSKGRLLNRKVEAIPAVNVQVWGKDVLIVKQPDVIRTSEDLPGYPSWLSFQDQLRGKEVVSMKGERAGQIEGVSCRSDGNLTALLLTKSAAGSKRLPISAVHSMGKDVLIVDLSKVS